MESKNNAREEAKAIVFEYKGDSKNPEEIVIETVISTKSTTTKRYKGVWKKNGKWIAQIRNPNTNSRVVLGSFHSRNAALFVYSSKKYEFESQIKDAELSNLTYEFESQIKDAELSNLTYEFESQIKDVELSNLMMIDNNGFLLGDFSRLDNELRIC